MYVGDDIPTIRDVHVAFVLSTICLGEIVKIDLSDALVSKRLLTKYLSKVIDVSCYAIIITVHQD